MSLCGDRVTRAGSGGGLAVMKAAAPALTGLALLAALGGFAVRDALTAVLHWYRRKTEAGLKARGRADT
jgi:hypothetical protein